jgi:hypothetical protein
MERGTWRTSRRSSPGRGDRWLGAARSRLWRHRAERGYPIRHSWQAYNGEAWWSVQRDRTPLPQRSSYVPQDEHPTQSCSAAAGDEGRARMEARLAAHWSVLYRHVRIGLLDYCRRFPPVARDCCHPRDAATGTLYARAIADWSCRLADLIGRVLSRQALFEPCGAFAGLCGYVYVGPMSACHCSFEFKAGPKATLTAGEPL